LHRKRCCLIHYLIEAVITELKSAAILPCAHGHTLNYFVVEPLEEQQDHVRAVAGTSLLDFRDGKSPACAAVAVSRSALSICGDCRVDKSCLPSASAISLISHAVLMGSA